MKLLRTLLILILLDTLSEKVCAQKEHQWEKYYNELSTIEDDKTGLSQSTFDELCDIEEHPININTATREDLERLPFLNENQIEEICEYLYRYKGMKTLGELQMIRSLDYYGRHILQCFVYVGDDGRDRFPSLQKIMRYGKSEILTSAKIPFYMRKGDSNGYLGYRYKHSIRYNLTYGDRFKIGIVGAQDAGEPFLSNKNSLGYDHYSYYMVMRDMGRLKTLALGCYKVSFGMGLVVNGGFNMGKVMMLSSLGRSTNNIRGNTSRAEGNYMQGAAATIEITKGLTASAFASYRLMDGTMRKDGTVTTIITNGYHRTQAEMDKKHNMSATTLGANIHYFKDGYHIGVTALYTSLDKTLNPNTAVIYRRFYAHGNDFFNISTDYGYICHRFCFNGEMALNDHNAIATINSLSVNVTGNLDILGLYRYYSKRYTALYANSFSDGGSVQNENGVYIGANWHPSRNLNVSGYTDFAYFVWPRYQVSGSSHSLDNMISAIYNTGNWSVLARYRMTVKQKDNASKSGLTNQVQHRVRLSATYSPAKDISLITQADMVHTEYKVKEKGWMINHNVDCKVKEWLKINANFGYFHTDGYDSRIYTYERGLLYDFSFPMLYGEGIRYALMAKTTFNKKVMVIAKISTTDYLDRTSIGNGYQKINKSALTDMELQLRLKL